MLSDEMMLLRNEIQDDEEDEEDEEDVDYSEAIERNHLDVVTNLDLERQFIFR